MRIACLFVCCLFVSCSVAQVPSVPQLQRVSFVDTKEAICEYAFVQGNWQFVHSVSFVMDSGYGATLVGVTVLQGKKLKTVLMGVEGFVLFEAEQEGSGRVIVRRAMPPFDKTGFARGLMRDVQTLFVEPEYAERTLAENTEGELICRYTADNNQVTDVVMAQQGWNRINLYDTQGMLQQSITALNYKEVTGENIPERIQLTTSGTQGYTLKLQLLSAEKL